MTTRRLKICKAIWHSNSMGSMHKTTVGEISRATGIPYSSVKRNLEWLWLRNVVIFDEFNYKGKKARDFSLTQQGAEIAQQKELF